MSATRKQQINVNHQASAFTLFLEHLDLAAVYTMFLNPLLHAFLEEIGKYFMFPIAAAANAVLAVLSWRQFYLDREPRHFVSALVQTAAAVAITVAVIGALVASAVFALATPIIFTATLGAKALYHAGAMFYHLFKGRNADTKEERTEHYEIAKKQAISAGAGILATVAVACVFLFGKFVVAGLGVAVSLFVAGYALYSGIKAFQATRAAEKADVSEVPLNDSGTTLGVTKSLYKDKAKSMLGDREIRDESDYLLSTSSSSDDDNNSDDDNIDPPKPNSGVRVGV